MGSPACFLAEETFQRSGNVSDLGHLQASCFLSLFFLPIEKFPNEYIYICMSYFQIFQDLRKGDVADIFEDKEVSA